MLIQITNRCHMECPHCMQEASPNGIHMTDKTFDQVYRFCKDAKPMVINITGGEPTEHPEWERYAVKLYSLPSVKAMMVLTNGAWIEEDSERTKIERLIRMGKGNIKVQVYSHPKYYRQHDWTVEHAQQFRSIGCITDFNSQIFMQDLGRARINCHEEILANSHVPSCINSHLFAMQSSSLEHFLIMAVQSGKVCRPLIDPEGYIHMSESCRCQSVAHVSDGVEHAFYKMRASRPCRGCRLYDNFVKFYPAIESLLM